MLLIGPIGNAMRTCTCLPIWTLPRTACSFVGISNHPKRVCPRLKTESTVLASTRIVARHQLTASRIRTGVYSCFPVSLSRDRHPMIQTHSTKTIPLSPISGTPINLPKLLTHACHLFERHRICAGEDNMPPGWSSMFGLYFGLSGSLP